MVLIDLQHLLTSLNLVSSLTKPVPSHGQSQITGGLLDTALTPEVYLPSSLTAVALEGGGVTDPAQRRPVPHHQAPEGYFKLIRHGAQTSSLGELSVAPDATDMGDSSVESQSEEGSTAHETRPKHSPVLLTLTSAGDNSTIGEVSSAPVTVNSTQTNVTHGITNASSGAVESDSPLPLAQDVPAAKMPFLGAYDDPSDSTDSDNSTNCPFTPYPSKQIPLATFAPFDPSIAMIYRYRQQQTVNLGSWFVQEQWMNPSLFTCSAGDQQAELDVAQGWGGLDNARQVLERHWDEWITEKDFEYLAGIGINTVRLPIGFWSLGPVYCQGTVFEPVAEVYANSWPRVIRAIGWAEKYGLGVLVDLHGAPGSQNGQAHGGTSDGQQNLFDSPTNIQLTVNILTYLTQQFGKVNNVVGIELLNEPSNVDSLPSFYTDTLTTLRKVSPEAATFPFYINDAYDLSRFADYVSTRQDFVVLDHHSYFVFDQTSEDTPAHELTTSLKPQGSLYDQLQSTVQEERKNLVIDEWSCALSSQSLANASDPERSRRRYCTGQMESYANSTAGWGFWSYKTENCQDDDNWCFVSAVGKSLPQTFFSYPDNSSISSLSLESTDSLRLPADQSYLAFGSTMPVVSGYGTSMADKWLEAIGSQNNLAQINEALAAAPQVPAGQLGSTQDGLRGTATIPSSRVQLALGVKRAVNLPSLGQRAFLLSSDLHRHRFVARHQRRRGRHGSDRSDDRGRALERRDDGQSKIELTPEQAAISRGYTDGWSAAKTFAATNRSRLGFTGQFMNDALSAMEGEIVSGDEQHYKSWFLKGLADGEMQVIKEMGS